MEPRADYDHLDADALRAEIELTQRTTALRRQRSLEIEGEYAAAEERQHLRRELETAHADAQSVEQDIDHLEMEVDMVDTDDAGQFAPQPAYVPVRRQFVSQTQSQLTRQEVIDPAQSVDKTCRLWTIKGMSWLIAAMAQEQVGTHTSRANFWCGGSRFDLVYNPTAAEQGGASLSLRHHNCSGLTCRYQFSILHADGDYRPWGEQGEVVLPETSPKGALYGPDTPAGTWVIGNVDLYKRQAEDGPIGVFGLDHRALTASEWVTDDCLSVKVDLEVRRDRDEGEDREWWMMTPRAPAETPADRIKVPEAVLAPNLGALFGDGAHSDVVFRVDGERVPAHMCILAAR
jgi:hypothetical protein